MGLPRQVSLVYTAAAANNIALSQSPGAGAITLNGALVSGGVATLDAARRVIVTSGGADTGITFTITGTNRWGGALTETITGASGAAASSTQDFKTVSSVTHTGSVASTVTVGTSGVGSTEWIMVALSANPINLGISVVVTGTINYSVEYTYDDPNAPFSATFPTPFTITSGSLTAKTANGDSQLNPFNFPIVAVRLTQNSFTVGATSKMLVLQTGNFS